MNYYKLIISYSGSHFCGWQFQQVNPNTAQQFLQEKLVLKTRTKNLSLYAASRTDRGVSASHQVVRLEIDKEVSTEKFARGFNEEFGQYMKIKSIEAVDSSFNPLYNIDYKEYHYYFSMGHVPPSLSSTIVELENLDISEMQKACELIKGSHDFKFFCVSGGRETNREVLNCEILEIENSPLCSDLYYLKISSTGFLKYMVRMIMGALIKLGRGEISLSDLESQLCGKETFTAKKASPYGLNLFVIKYQ